MTGRCPPPTSGPVSRLGSPSLPTLNHVVRAALTPVSTEVDPRHSDGCGKEQVAQSDPAEGDTSPGRVWRSGRGEQLRGRKWQLCGADLEGEPCEAERGAQGGPWGGPQEAAEWRMGKGMGLCRPQRTFWSDLKAMWSQARSASSDLFCRGDFAPAGGGMGLLHSAFQDGSSTSEWGR